MLRKKSWRPTPGKRRRPAHVEEDVRGNGDHFQADEEQDEVAGDGREHQPGDGQQQRAEPLGGPPARRAAASQRRRKAPRAKASAAAVGGQGIDQQRSAGIGDKANRHKTTAAAAIAPPASHRHNPAQATNAPPK